ncbi:MAG: acyl carrier protein [Propionivibrio sp.]
MDRKSEAPAKVSSEVLSEVLSILDEVLSLKGRAQTFTRETPLLGALPELDSMAVVALITMLEERFGFFVEDDEIDGSAFASVGSLTSFVQGKLDA